MANKIQFKRGVKANLPTLSVGEPALCTDTEQFFVGGSSGNIELAKASDLSDLTNKKVSKTTADVTYYVSPTGLDTSDGLTTGTAFRTIAKAISCIPQIVNHVVTIVVASGTYTEPIILNGFFGSGAIVVSGGTNNTTATSFIVTQVQVKSCNCIVNITAFATTITTDSAFILIGSNFVSLISCVCTASSSSYSGISAKNGSNCYAVNCIISNRSYGIMVANGTTLMSEANLGSGNTTGIYAQNGATIAKYSTQPSGTTAEGTIAGGVIR